MSAKVIQVIETDLMRRGDGKDTPIRVIKQYWSLDGNLLVEVDPIGETKNRIKSIIDDLIDKSKKYTQTEFNQGYLEALKDVLKRL